MLPSRLIEVSPPASLNRPRLHIPTNEEKGKYVALSYCWSSNPFVGLRKSNLDAMLDRIDPLTLPRTIADAIAVTKAISIPYLWIDTLCIIQDCPEDMKKEIANMADVYETSLLTLVAASSASVTDGFLQNRSTFSGWTYTIPFRLAENSFGTMSFGDLYDREYDESTEPINTRAWTLQEPLLASRYLIYSSHTLQWRCHAGVRNLGNSLHLVSYAEEDQHSDSLHTRGNRSNNKNTQLSRWMRLVRVYSSRSMCFPHDKLNAVSAVATAFSITLRERFHAGLWHSEILRQLTWVPVSSWKCKTSSHLPEPYRAPSWSWASIDGGVEYESEFVEHDTILPPYRCGFITCETTPKTENFQFGEITSGFLKLTGVLREAWFKPQSKQILWLAEDDPSLEAAEHQAAQKENKRRKSGSDSEIASRDLSMKGYHDESEQQDPIPVCCLPLFARADGDSIVAGLLLATTQNGIYARVGSFKRALKTDFDHLPETETTIV